MLCQAPEARILFVCTEALTRRVNWSDRSTCVLFGDAATACVLTASADKALAGVEDVICQSDGNQRDHHAAAMLRRHGLGQPTDENFFITMQGPGDLQARRARWCASASRFSPGNGLSIEDVTFVLHQANMRIIEAVGSRLNIAEDRVFTNVERYGNTSSASIPLALAEASAGAAQSCVLMTAFGAGLTWGGPVEL